MVDIYFAQNDPKSDKGMVMAPSAATEGWAITDYQKPVFTYSSGGIPEDYDLYGPSGSGFYSWYYNVTGTTLGDRAEIIWKIDDERLLYIYGLSIAKKSAVGVDAYNFELIGSIDELGGSKAFSQKLTLGNDAILGTRNPDVLYAGPGDDQVDGRADDDRLSGDAGNDWLSGGSGDDRLYGGSGQDFLGDKRGDDKFFGGADADTFYFGLKHDKDIIKGLSVSEDIVQIDRDLATKMSQLKAIAINYRGGVILKFSTDDQLKIEGIKAKNLNKIDFEFVKSSFDYNDGLQI